MSRALSLFAIGLVFGGGAGFVTAAGMGVTFDGHDHTDPAHHAAMSGDHAAAHHTPVNLPAAAAPTVEIGLTPDPVSGYTLQILTSNFAFSPKGASGQNVPGEGHAHLYINGQKKGRLYGPWAHVDGLPKGDVDIAVSLNTNDHRPIHADGTPVRASATVSVE